MELLLIATYAAICVAVFEVVEVVIRLGLGFEVWLEIGNGCG